MNDSNIQSPEYQKLMENLEITSLFAMGLNDEKHYGDPFILETIEEIVILISDILSVKKDDISKEEKFNEVINEVKNSFNLVIKGYSFFRKVDSFSYRFGRDLYEGENLYQIELSHILYGKIVNRLISRIEELKGKIRKERNKKDKNTMSIIKNQELIRYYQNSIKNFKEFKEFVNSYIDKLTLANSSSIKITNKTIRKITKS